MPLLLVFLLGIVCGLRTFTAPAVLWIVRHRGPWAYLLAAAALFEYFFDLHPKAPPRSAISNLVAGLISGAFVGWWAAAATNISPASGVIAGVAGALVGTYGGLAIRRRANMAIGNRASGVLEDIVAITASVAIVAQL